MQAAFGTVLWIVCAFGVVVAIVLLILGRKTWEEYGKNSLVMEGERPDQARAGSVAAMIERETEIRQMLDARNARRARRGEPPLDVEQELARLSEPHIDGALRAEIRELVVARNHRRVRAGKPPLDVEAEIKREIAGLSGLGL